MLRPLINNDNNSFFLLFLFINLKNKIPKKKQTKLKVKRDGVMVNVGAEVPDVIVDESEFKCND